MLTLTNLSLKYRGAFQPAVSDVSLEVREGEVLAMVGESGSGKTSLLRMIAGLEYPGSGSIHLSGQKVADGKGRSWIPPEKRQVGLVFQSGALFPHMTAAANVAYGLGGRSREEKRQLVREHLALTGLDGFEERYPHQLSGGERQRLAVARALAPKPKLILMDEPFSNLDPPLRRSLREEILSILKKAGATAIVVTHDTDDALAMGDRIAVIRKGEIAQLGDPEELYFHPKNAYCARLFGPVNEVVNNSGEPTWIRPERMAISQTQKTPEDHQATVVVTRNVGRHVEVSVTPTDKKQKAGGKWTVYAARGASFSKGDKVWVTEI